MCLDLGRRDVLREFGNRFGNRILVPGQCLDKLCRNEYRVVKPVVAVAADEDMSAALAGDVGATADQLNQYFGEEFMKNEFRKELATNLIVDSAVVKAAE